MPLPSHLSSDAWRRICAVLDRLQQADAEMTGAQLEAACAAEGVRTDDVRPFLAIPHRDEQFLDRLDPDVLAECARELADTAPATLATGDRLGPYEITRGIGSGGMGDVYEGRDTRLDRPVAIKLLQPHAAGRTEGRRRFEQEARAISALNHPHVCTLFDVGETDSTPYLVMELLEGETLADRLRRSLVPIDQCIEYIAQIADALAAAHRQGIVHRDLKPANIMLTTHGVKLLDFGIAALQRTGGGPPGQHLDAENQVFGTLDYMAPEQLAGAAGDARTDIFALGAIAFEMFTGQRAFAAEGRTGVVKAILDAPTPAVSTRRPGVASAIDWAVGRCLAKNPEERWQSAADLALHLRWGASDPGVRVTASSARLRRGLIAAAGLLIVLAAITAALWRPWQASAVSHEVVRYEIPPPEGWTFERTLALSPDGRRIAFTATDVAGRRTLWIRPLDAVEPQAVAGTEGAFYPFWSPDGRFVGFFADQKLKKVELASGVVQIICATGFGGGGTWNQDGVILFSTQSTTSPALLQRVQASGGTPEPVTRQTAKQTLHSWPHFLPDGRHYLYMRLELPGASGIFLGLLGQDEHQPLLTQSFENKKLARSMRELGGIVGRAQYAGGYLFFVRTGTVWAQQYDVTNFKLIGDPVRVIDRVAQDSPGRAALDVSEGGVLVYREPPDAALNQLTWFDQSGREAGRVGEPGPYDKPAVSSDGRGILADHAGTGGPIVRIDSIRGTPTEVTRSGMTPTWSPDGTEILFRGGGGPIVSAAKIDGSEPEGHPIGPAFNAWPGQWLNDGRFVGTAIRSETTSWDVFIKSVFKPGSDVTFLVATPADETDPRVSPDGRWLAYAARDDSRQWQVFVRPFDRNGLTERVSMAGGRFPRWSRSSSELFYVSPDGGMMRARVSTSQEFKVLTTSTLFRHQALMDGYAAGLKGSYDLAPDGRFLLVIPVKQPKPSPISVLLNWPAIVKR